MPSSDPTANLMPNKPKDFIAFINLVDFCRCQNLFFFLLAMSEINKSNKQKILFAPLFHEIA